MNIVTVNNVSKVFRRASGPKLLRDYLRDLFKSGKDTEPFYALKNVSFAIDAQESVAIIGGNGAGKSTMLGLIAGLAQPDEGSVEVNGRIAALLELGSGFHPELSGTENIFLNAALLGFNEKQTKELLGAIVEFAELRESINQPIRTFSTGMVMRLAFSVAVHVEPAILIVDEVLAVGDVAFQDKCYRKIQALRDEGRTLICVTHAIPVMRTCDRCIWLHRGELVMDGRSSEVAQAYEQYMAAPENGLPTQTAEPVNKVRVLRAGSKAKGRRRG
jgi:ABC-type polysaccharide/polyol phosphate transport system ATPase subunit